MERLQIEGSHLTEDGVEQMLMLAERLRASNGGTLDDAAILAVAEATGAPAEYVRLAEQLRTQRDVRKSGLAKAKAAFITLDSNVRRHVVSGILGTGIALLQALEVWSQVAFRIPGMEARDPSPIFGMLKLIAITFALYNVSISRESRTAAVSGAITGGVAFAAFTVFAFLFRIPNVDSTVLVPVALASALGGLVLQKLVDTYRVKLGLRDPVKERQDLLRQLHELQARLNSGRQSMTFLSIDIVGSTRMKETSDPLSVEFTFTEYHNFVEMAARRYSGRVHSTAGDGIICAFDDPQMAYGAARNIQTGLVELNTFRNKIGIPLVLRCGIHTGEVVAPTVGDVKSVNFAHVIDIAAHLQKVCPEGGVAISEAAAKHLPGGLAAVGGSRVEAQGVGAVVWMPKQHLSMGASRQPPTPASQDA